MSRIRLFEEKPLTEAERLRGLSHEMVTPLARRGLWRRALPHAEPRPALIWITRGQGRLTILARTRGYSAGTAVAIPAGTPFAIEPGMVTEASLLVLPDLFEAPMPSEPLHLRLLETGLQAELTGLVDLLARCGDLTDRAAGRAALARVILISAFLEREGRRQPQTKLRAAERLAARFAQAVETHLGDGANLETIAATLGVSPAHLTRTLRATCGTTAAAYLQARLMHEARRRLADTDDSAATIAAGLGFSSPAYFTRAFGRETGMTPSAFRRDEGRKMAG